MILGVKKLNSNAKIPTYADNGASGFDFYSTDKLILMPGTFRAIGTGVAFDIPKGYEIQARGRSGLAFKYGILAHFGTIDDSFKGEVKVLLFNLGSEPYEINVGDRIGQGVLAPVTKADFYEKVELSESSRGSNGFGSTGK